MIFTNIAVRFPQKLEDRVSDTVYAGVILTFVDINELKKTKSELRQHEQEEMERLATFVHYSNDAITLQDAEGNIVTWNRGAENLYGWTEQKALMIKYQQIVAESSHALLHSILNKLKAGDTVPQYEALRISKSGKLINVSVSPTVLYSKYFEKELIAFLPKEISLTSTNPWRPVALPVYKI